MHENVATIPLEVEQVVLQALAKDPRDRFASVCRILPWPWKRPAERNVLGQTSLRLSSAYATGSSHATLQIAARSTHATLGREQDVRQPVLF